MDGHTLCGLISQDSTQDDDSVLDQPTPTATQQLTSHLVDMTDQDALDVEHEKMAEEYAALFPEKINVRIADLMDFTNKYWLMSCEAVGERGLNEEAELCELLETADRDTDTALASGGELDNSVESLLTA